MNSFLKISALSIAAALIGVSAQAAEADRFDVAAMEVQGGPIAAPVIKIASKAERLVDTSRAAVKAEQARAWAAGEMDFGYTEVNGGAMPRGTATARELRMANRKTQ